MIQTLHMTVRDYECDMQGVVNNAVYQNYLEHARHLFLKQQQVDFAALARNGINLVVVRAELDYKSSLSSGDEFIVTTKMERSSKLKFVFVQDIHVVTKKVTEQVTGQVTGQAAEQIAKQRLALSARITGVALDQGGKPFVPDFLANMLN